MIRLPLSASATIARYRGSKMCNGTDMCGKSITSGSGKIGIVAGKAAGGFAAG